MRLRQQLDSSVYMLSQVETHNFLVVWWEKPQCSRTVTALCATKTSWILSHVVDVSLSKPAHPDHSAEVLFSEADPTRWPTDGEQRENIKFLLWVINTAGEREKKVIDAASAIRSYSTERSEHRVSWGAALSELTLSCSRTLQQGGCLPRCVFVFFQLKGRHPQSSQHPLKELEII